MTLDESIQGMRLRVMKRAQVVGVTAACRDAGISRTVFYRWRGRLERYGVDGVHPRRLRARPGPAPKWEHIVRVASDTSQRQEFLVRLDNSSTATSLLQPVLSRGLSWETSPSPQILGSGAEARRDLLDLLRSARRHLFQSTGECPPSTPQV